jgi:hypothetical protein
MALKYGEFRESVNLDFLVSDREGYRELRQMIRQQNDLKALWRIGGLPPQEEREPLADQYGIRARVMVDRGGRQIRDRAGGPDGTGIWRA